MGEGGYGHDPSVIDKICLDVKTVFDKGLEVCLVVGGGNILRGATASKMGIERSSADYMGMLATVINAIALQSSLEKIGLQTRISSAIPMTTICEPYIRRKAVRHMEKRRVVIFAAGTGNPFFTTDTAAALRAVEMKCDALLKATGVDGIYDSDPKLNKNAKRYEKISYEEVLHKNLKVMDAAAISLARENNLPVLVFSLKEENILQKIFANKASYSLVS